MPKRHPWHEMPTKPTIAMALDKVMNQIHTACCTSQSSKVYWQFAEFTHSAQFAVLVVPICFVTTFIEGIIHTVPTLGLPTTWPCSLTVPHTCFMHPTLVKFGNHRSHVTWGRGLGCSHWTCSGHANVIIPPAWTVMSWRSAGRWNELCALSKASLA